MEATLFDVPRPARQPGAQSAQLDRMIAARVAAGLLDTDLYAAEIALARDAALALDNPDPGTKPYALNELRSGYLNILATIPRPTEPTGSTSDLDRALAVIQGGAA